MGGRMGGEKKRERLAEPDDVDGLKQENSSDATMEKRGGQRRNGDVTRAHRGNLVRRVRKESEPRSGGNVLHKAEGI